MFICVYYEITGETTHILLITSHVAIVKISSSFHRVSNDHYGFPFMEKKNMLLLLLENTTVAINMQYNYEFSL